MSARINQGFTMIELLVVIGIIVILAGLLLPVMTIAGDRAAQNNALALVRKVETGLDQFKAEMGTYPFRQYDDSSDSFGTIDNDLAWRLGSNMTEAEHTALQGDLAKVRRVYSEVIESRDMNDNTMNDLWLAMEFVNPHAVQFNEVDPRIEETVREQSYNSGPMLTEEINMAKNLHMGVANRMAAERASLAILAGNVEVKGILDRENVRVVADASSRGIALDYLSNELRNEEIRGEAIIDPWGRPLLFNCPVTQGLRDSYPPSSIIMQGGNRTAADQAPPASAEYYGLETIGRTAATDLSYDQRVSAAPTYRERYEVWSAGPDGLIHPQRDHVWNRDNIAATDYDAELQ